jgi:integrase
VADHHQWFAAFLIATLYGLRRGEVLGLRWQDIDFARRVISIRQQVFRAGGQVQIGSVKTKAGERDLPLLDVIADVLLEHRQSTSLAKGLVFTTPTGNPIEPQNFSRSFQRMCARYELRRIKLHHLRHGTATLLKDLGVPDKDIQLILGHSSVTVTQKIYQHTSMEARRSALDRAADALFLTKLGDGSSMDDSGRSRQNSRQAVATPRLSDHVKQVQDIKSSPATGVTVAGLLDNFFGEPKGD